MVGECVAHRNFDYTVRVAIVVMLASAAPELEKVYLSPDRPCQPLVTRFADPLLAGANGAHNLLHVA